MEVREQDLGRISAGCFYDQKGKCLSTSGKLGPSLKTLKSHFRQSSFQHKEINSLEDARKFLDIALYDALKLQICKAQPRTLYEKCFQDLEVSVPCLMIRVQSKQTLETIDEESAATKQDQLPSPCPSHIIKSVVFGEETVVVLNAVDSIQSPGQSVKDTAHKTKLLKKIEDLQRDEGENFEFLGDSDVYQTQIHLMEDRKVWNKTPFKESGWNCRLYSTCTLSAEPDTLDALMKCLNTLKKEVAQSRSGNPISCQLIPITNPQPLPFGSDPLEDSSVKKNRGLFENLLEGAVQCFEDLLATKKKLNDPETVEKMATESMNSLVFEIETLHASLEKYVSILDIRVSNDKVLRQLRECIDEYQSILGGCSNESLLSYVDDRMADYRSANLQVLLESDWHRKRAEGMGVKDIQEQDMQMKKAIDQRVKRYQLEPSSDDVIVCELPNKDMTVMLIGVGGIGKSSLGNLLLGREVFKTGCSEQAITTFPEIQGTQIESIGQHLWVLDTPPIPSTSSSRRTVRKWVQTCTDILGDSKLDAILLVLDAETSTIGPNLEAGLKHILNTLGESVFEIGIAVLTKVDNMERAFRDTQGPLSANYLLQREVQSEFKQLLEKQLKKKIILVDPMAESDYERKEYQKAIVSMINRIRPTQPVSLKEKLEQLKSSDYGFLCDPCTIL